MTTVSFDADDDNDDDEVEIFNNFCTMSNIFEPMDHGKGNRVADWFLKIILMNLLHGFS